MKENWETLAGLTVKKYIILETSKCSHSCHSLICPQFIMCKPTDALMCLVVLF